MARVTGGLPGAGYKGRFGNAVFYEGAGGLRVIPRVTTANPRTPSQTRGRAEFALAAQGWGRLSDAEFAAWEAAGGYRAYVALTRKWLRMHPGGSPPTLPPAGPFLGDNVGLTIDHFRLTIREETSSIVDGQSSILSISADRANGAGVVTEILVQPLANARRKPKGRGWRSAGFFAFTDAVRSATIPVAMGPGTAAVAVSYRFVEAATGRETATASLGAVARGG